MNKKFLGIISCGILSVGLLVGCSGQEPQDGFDEDAPVNGEQPAAPVQTEPEIETSDTEDPNAPMNEEGAEIESEGDTSINGTPDAETDTSTELGEEPTEEGTTDDTMDSEPETEESGF
jgi:hypothetical protein